MTTPPTDPTLLQSVIMPTPNTPPPEPRRSRAEILHLLAQLWGENRTWEDISKALGVPAKPLARAYYARSLDHLSRISPSLYQQTVERYQGDYEAWLRDLAAKQAAEEAKQARARASLRRTQAHARAIEARRQAHMQMALYGDTAVQPPTSSPSSSLALPLHSPPVGAYVPPSERIAYTPAWEIPADPDTHTPGQTGGLAPVPGLGGYPNPILPPRPPKEAPYAVILQALTYLVKATPDTPERNVLLATLQQMDDMA